MLVIPCYMTVCTSHVERIWKIERPSPSRDPSMNHDHAIRDIFTGDCLHHASLHHSLTAFRVEVTVTHRDPKPKLGASPRRRGLIGV